MCLLVILPGFVSNHVPLLTRYIHSRREHLIVTCVGRVFHTYGGAKLGLLSVSKIHPDDITCMSAGKKIFFLKSLKNGQVLATCSLLCHF